MTRYIKSGTVNRIQEINSELEKIATAQEDFLSLDGETPNAMRSNLDMNSNRITNLPVPVNDNDVLRLIDLNPIASTAIAGLFNANEELLIVSAGQVVFTFPSVKSLAGSSFYIRSPNGDLGARLIEGYDFVFRSDLGEYSLELTRAWDAGTILQRIYTSTGSATVASETFKITTSNLILSTRAYISDTVVRTTGYSTSTDGGAGVWAKNGVTGQNPSQSPMQLGSNILNDANGTQWALQGDLNLKALGGTTSDVTLAYNAAVGALNSGVKATMRLPAGDYGINPATTTTIYRVSASIEGEGMGVSRFLTTATGGAVTKFERNGGSETLSISNISYIADSGTTSTAIQAEDTSLGVNGGIDSLILSNVEAEATSSNWWRKHIVMIEVGGLVINYAYLRNGGQSAAQNDVNTASIEVRNLKAGVFIIRAIDASHLYIQRANTCVLLTAEQSIESVYFNSGEMVGADYGVRTEGAGKVGAIKIDVHMDCIKRNILANSDFNFCKIIGDLRLSNNGASVDTTGICCEFNANVEMMLANGSVAMAGSANSQRGFKFNGNVIQSQINPQIKGDGVGLDMVSSGIVFGVSATPTFSNGITTRFLGVPNEVLLGSLQSENANYTGDIDLLFNTVVADGLQRTQTHILTSTATNIPAGTIAGGSVVTTVGIDANAGHQTLSPINAGLNFNYVRTKTSGVISSWGRQGAPLNGTFASPTSITVENGIVTAVSV